MIPETPPEADEPVHDIKAEAKLTEQLGRYNISLSPGKVRRLAKYCKLLWFWNEKLNLTRHTDFEKFVARDLVDSLALAEFLEKGERILDVGTGGGVPGIVLAIVRPDLEIELCDSTGKKANAVAEILREMKIEEIPVWNSKAEDLLTKRKYTTLTVRAVSRMPQLLKMFAPHWHSFERILLLKGPNWVAERGESRHLGLMENLALRVLKAYPPQAEEELVSSGTQSVVLQVCQKNKFEKLTEIIKTVIEKQEYSRKKKEDRKPRKKFSHKKPFSKKPTAKKGRWKK